MSKSTVNPEMSGLNLLQSSRYNKGTAFSETERATFGLHGLLPHRVETIEEQKKRVWLQYSNQSTAIAKNLYLNQLARTNTTLFYAFVEEHLAEMLPIIYTPTIGEAVQKFSSNFTQQQGLVLSYPDMDRIDGILAGFAGQPFDIIAATDGEGVLGIGDQGIGGLDIAIGKLMVYTLCGGINPFRTLPVMLDVGTNNQKLLDDPLYLGWRHARISGDQYAKFIESFTRAFKKYFPRTLLHWEDFGRDNARAVLDRYRLFHPSFNDDIQGTGAVALAAVLAGIRKTGIAGEITASVFSEPAQPRADRRPDLPGNRLPGRRRRRKATRKLLSNRSQRPATGFTKRSAVFSETLCQNTGAAGRLENRQSGTNQSA